MNPCPTRLPEIPAASPRRADPAACEAAFGKGALCYAAADAVVLGLTLDALVGLYLERSACETGDHANPRDPD